MEAEQGWVYRFHPESTTDSLRDTELDFLSLQLSLPNLAKYPGHHIGHPVIPCPFSPGSARSPYSLPPGHTQAEQLFIQQGEGIACVVGPWGGLRLAGRAAAPRC